MRVHPATTPLPTTTALGRNPIPSTSITRLCPENNTGRKTREMVDRLVPLQHMGKASARRLAQQIETGIRQTGSTMADSLCNLPIQTQQSRLYHQTVQRTAAGVWCNVVILPSSPFNTQSVRVPTSLHAQIFSFYARKPPST